MPVQNSPYHKKTTKKLQGFSFIELLVAMAMMALIFTVGFANYRDFQDRQRLVAAARLLKTDLRYAQEQALAGIKPATCNSLNGYRVIGTSSTVYQIEANCDAAGTNIAVKTVDFAKFNPNIRFNPAMSMVFFNILGRGTKLNSDLTITLENTKNGETTAIVVTKGGEIK